MNRLAAALSALDSDNLDGQLAGTLRGLMRGYDRYWGGVSWETVEVEQQFTLPIVNPETNRTSRTFTHAGRVDGIVRFEGRDYLLEHKTTSEDISDPNAPYWRRLAIDAQVSGYVLSYWQMGRKLEGTLYDVIRKPSIRPKQITKTIAQQIIVGGMYCHADVSDATREVIRNGKLEIENSELFEARLVADIAERPDWYFQRRTIPRLDGEVAEYATELWETADEIRQARVGNRHYRNPGACMLYNSPCEFLGLCSGHDSVESDNWRKRESVHAELETDGDGRDVLSHSRMQTFRTCRRKHFYRYELGIEPNKEEKEALYFGRLLHEALAAWWAPNQVEASVCQP